MSAAPDTEKETKRGGVLCWLGVICPATTGKITGTGQSVEPVEIIVDCRIVNTIIYNTAMFQAGFQQLERQDQIPHTY